MIQRLLLLLAVFQFTYGLAGAGKPSEINFDRISFLSRWTKSGTVHFSNGEYREAGAPNSAIELIVKLTDQRAFGKLDGKEAGAVIVVTDPGGSGSFYDLALLVKNPQGWINQDVAFLGDRIKIRSLAIANDAIVVGMYTHRPEDAMCCPSREVLERFVLRDDRLIKAKAEVQGKPGPSLTDTVWKWHQTLYSNDTRSLPPNPENYTLELLPDGKVSIRADCNRGGGVYTLRESEISIEITYTTRAACPPESLEQGYIRDLNATVRYRIEGDFLFIDLKNDTGTMKFMR